MTKYSLQLNNLNQSGIVSITVTMVFIMVISLTVLGFSQVTQRNSRQALDRHLSSQAFYAAETGVNDTMSKIAELSDAGQPIPEQTSCEGPYTKGSGVIDQSDPEILYTCLRVDPTPDVLNYNNLNDSSIAFPISKSPGTLLNDFKVRWYKDGKSTANVAGCQGATNNRLAADWVRDCPFGIVRLDLLPYDVTTISNPLEAARQTMTVFIYPKSPGGATPTIFYTPTANAYGVGAPQGLVESAACNVDYCEANLSNLNFNRAYVRIRMLYVPTPTFQVSSSSGSFSDTQVVVDVTGKARDVLRRIKVQLSIKGGSSRSDLNGFSDYAIQTTDTICKRFITSPILARDRCSSFSSGGAGLPRAPVSDGDALMGGRGCDPNDTNCTGWKDNEYHYDHQFVNRSSNDPATVAGCSWDFGDGTVVNNVACNKDEETIHTFPRLNPEPPFPSACYSPKAYTVTLTMNLNNGTSYNDVRRWYVPYCYL